jgi:thymidylate synthase (FAD)
MKIVEPGFEILSPLKDGKLDAEAMLRLIERAGRICYKSEERIGPGTAERFVEMIIKRKHESVLEHASITVLFVMDRGVSHEIVRHRLCAFSQESTRYCNYGKSGEVTFIRPIWWGSDPDQSLIDLYRWNTWYRAMELAEFAYLELLRYGAKPEQARSVLPNSLKTEIVVTANLRQWRHILEQRTAPQAHPQMRQVICPLAAELAAAMPSVFGEFSGTSVT